MIILENNLGNRVLFALAVKYNQIIRTTQESVGE